MSLWQNTTISLWLMQPVKIKIRLRIHRDCSLCVSMAEFPMSLPTASPRSDRIALDAYVARDISTGSGSMIDIIAVSVNKCIPSYNYFIRHNCDKYHSSRKGNFTKILVNIYYGYLLSLPSKRLVMKNTSYLGNCVPGMFLGWPGKIIFSPEPGIAFPVPEFTIIRPILACFGNFWPIFCGIFI